MVRDTGFEPVTPTVSRYIGLLEANSFFVGDSIWIHANPCRNGKCYSEMLQWFDSSSCSAPFERIRVGKANYAGEGPTL